MPPRRWPKVDARLTAHLARGACDSAAVIAFAGADQGFRRPECAATPQLRDREHRARGFERIQSKARRFVLGAQIRNAEHSPKCTKSPKRCRCELRVRRKVCALLRIITIREQGRGRETMIRNKGKCHV